jgi:hypothetical protein
LNRRDAGVRHEQPLVVTTGLETELGLLGPGRMLKLREEATRLVVERVLAGQASARGLGDKHRDIHFLANGAAFGLDPPWPTLEYSTPECLDPFELAASLKAGMRLVTRAAIDVEAALGRPIVPVAASLYQVDGGITVGTHENYGFGGVPDETLAGMRECLLAWAICRQPLVEPGFLSRAPGSSGFALGPRAHLMQHVTGGSTTRGRAVFTEGRTTYAGRGQRRLHMISAGATLSPWAVALRHGVSMLLVVMCGLGWRLPTWLRLREPLNALRQVSRDAAALLETARGSATALELVEELLSEARLAHAVVPLAPWAARLLGTWEHVLSVVRERPAETELWLEAPLRWRVLERYLRSEGLDWDAARAWTQVVETIRAVCADQHCRVPTTTAAVLEQLPDPVRNDLRLAMRRPGLDWSGLGHARRVVDRLHILDVEMGRIDGGIADRQSSWRTARGLEVIDLAHVERLETTPPARTRARARGLLITRHAGDERLRASWDVVLTDDCHYRMTAPEEWRLPRRRRGLPLRLRPRLIDRLVERHLRRCRG